jgi:hypothetical protein
MGNHPAILDYAASPYFGPGFYFGFYFGPEYEIGGQKRTSTLTVKKEGDKFVGTMDWADQKDEKLKDPKFKDGKLTFSAVRKFQGNTIPIDYTLKIDGDEFKGKGEADFGGQKQEFQISGLASNSGRCIRHVVALTDHAGGNRIGGASQGSRRAAQARSARRLDSRP